MPMHGEAVRDRANPSVQVLFKSYFCTAQVLLLDASNYSLLGRGPTHDLRSE